MVAFDATAEAEAWRMQEGQGLGIASDRGEMLSACKAYRDGGRGMTALSVLNAQAELRERRLAAEHQQII